MSGYRMGSSMKALSAIPRLGARLADDIKTPKECRCEADSSGEDAIADDATMRHHSQSRSEEKCGVATVETAIGSSVKESQYG
jgi:hypothetical protein